MQFMQLVYLNLQGIQFQLVYEWCPQGFCSAAQSYMVTLDIFSQHPHLHPLCTHWRPINSHFQSLNDYNRDLSVLLLIQSECSFLSHSQLLEIIFQHPVYVSFLKPFTAPLILIVPSIEPFFCLYLVFKFSFSSFEVKLNLQLNSHGGMSCYEYFYLCFPFQDMHIPFYTFIIDLLVWLTIFIYVCLMKL